jgi:AraC-like DNA-binding protein
LPPIEGLCITRMIEHEAPPLRGQSVGSHVEQVIETNDRIEAIAEDCGYSGEEQMRAAFVRVLNIPPREYRKRFASSKRSLL